MTSDSNEMKKRSLNNIAPLRRRATVTMGGEELVRAEPLRPGTELPLLIQPAVEGVDLVAWASTHRDWMEERLLRHGGLLFRGFAIESPEDLEHFVAAVAGETLEYRERSSPRSQVAGNIYTSTDHPADQSIFFHNENSYQNDWPLKIFFFCYIPSPQGGETPIVDTRRVYGRVPADVRRRFEERGVMYVRNFRPGVGLPWQTVFQSDDRPYVEAYCHDAALEAEWLDGDALRVRSVRPAVVRHPKTGEPIWFNHGTFFHVSTLEEPVRKALLTQFAEEDLPNNTYYGDGSPIEPEVLDTLRAAYRQEAVVFPWQKRDVLLLDNMMVAHAREPFEGPRKILIGMAEPVNRRTVAVV